MFFVFFIYTLVVLFGLVHICVTTCALYFVLISFSNTVYQNTNTQTASNPHKQSIHSIRQ